MMLSSYYSEAKKQWVVEPGKYDLLAGSSSGDLRVKGVVTK
jgi:beta-glucosidase